MARRLLLVLGLLACLAGAVVEAAPATKPARAVLPNGLAVVVAERRGLSVVTLDTWVKVGSRDETDELAGAAHFVEHMLFKGTRRRRVGEINREVEALGGVLNASTGFDYTHYYIVADRRFFDRVLDLQADALMNSTFDPQEVERERQVVLQELALIEDTPARAAIFRLFGTAYRVHPYRRPVGGTPEGIRRLTREQLLQFYRSHYGPANVTVVVAGDVRAEEVVAEVRRALGGWRRPVQGRLPAPSEPPIAGVRRTNEERDVRVVTLAIGWIGPDVRNPDHYAADVLAYALGRGRAARLVRTLQDRQRIVQTISAAFQTAVDPGLFYVQATTEPQSRQEAEAALLREIEAVRRDGLTHEELQRAKTLLETDVLVAEHTSQGLAAALGFASTVADLDYHETYLARIRAVTQDDVLRVVRRYLDPGRYAVVTIRPRGAP
jgi:zinc protease